MRALPAASIIVGGAIVAALAAGIVSPPARAQSSGSAPAPSAAAAAQGPLELTVTEAVLMALEGNRELSVERLGPDATRTSETEEMATFDPVLYLDRAGWEESRGQKLRGVGLLETYEVASPVGVLGLGLQLPTGMSAAIEASTEVPDEAELRQLVQSRIGFEVRQSFLRDMGLEPGLARVRQAQIDTRISEYELRGFTEELVARVEETDWDHALHLSEVRILEDSIALATRQLRDTEERVKAGLLGSVEIAAAKSEIALRTQDLIDARAAAESSRLDLLRLLNPGGEDIWSREVRLTTALAAAPEPPGDTAAHVANAMRMRPELNQAQLLLDRDRLELVRTKNGLLPRMDFFIAAGRSGYSDSFEDSWRNLGPDHYDVFAGLSFEFPVRNRAARARHERAQSESRQAELSIANLRQLVELDVRKAFIEIERAKQILAAASETRALDEEKLTAELEKHRAGRASAFQVARAQRDLARSRIAEATARADTQKALVDLYRLEGVLLEKRGVRAPGDPAPAGTPARTARSGANP